MPEEIESGRKALLDLGAKLGAKRKTAAPKLAASVTAHLRDLGFKKSEFTGAPANRLKAIASSGEIAHVVGACK